MKVTIKAILINETISDKSIINNMMLVFSTAKRYSFKRLLENNINIRQLEKDITKKYNLNIRQSKDAVESARQTIQSQKELIKMNYEDYSKKVKSTEKLLIDDKGYIMGECGHKYRSVVINGKISFAKDLEEKKYGMEIILKHLEENPSVVKAKALKSEKMYDNIAILRLEIKSLIGKKGQ